MLQLRCRSDEFKCRPLSSYLQRIQKEMNEEDRSKFVDFLIFVAHVANVSKDTIHAAVRIADRYLSVKSLKKRKIRAFGFACLIIASKMYEVDAAVPTAAHLAKQITEFEDYAQTEDAEVIYFEAKILMALNFDVLLVPTVFTFIRYALSIAEPKSRVEYWKLKYLAEYLGELTLLDYKFLRYNASLIAASIIYYALLVLNPKDKNPWDGCLKDLTGYSLTHMMDCVKDVHCLHRNTALRKICDTVDKKYGVPEAKCVAILSPPKALPPPFDYPIEKIKWFRRRSI